jgi:hypothetical protein
VQADGAGEAFNRFESGAGVGDILAVVFRQRAEGEAIADRLLVFGVNIFGITRWFCSAASPTPSGAGPTLVTPSDSFMACDR